MSQSLQREINTTSKEVNAIINSMFVNEHTPKVIYDASKHLIDAGGKRLRPFLTLKSCEILGGRKEDALYLAASIELVHTFTIIHDDIMDRDFRRRGVPTVHVQWDVPIAITAGDMLFAKAFETALCSAGNVTPKKLLKIISSITKATISICEGQTLDLLFEKRRDVVEEEYLDMIYKKTAALLEAAAKVGALIGVGTPLQVKKLSDMGRNAGFAFQIYDDILGLTADEEILGKPLGSDIRAGKSTIPIIHALAQGDEEQRKQILSVLGNKIVERKQITETIEIIRSLGSIEYATSKAEMFIKRAKAPLSYFNSSPTKDILTDFCEYIISRNF